MEEQITAAGDVAHWSPCSWPQGLGFHQVEGKKEDEEETLGTQASHMSNSFMDMISQITHRVRRESPDTQSMINPDDTECSSDWV